MPFSEQVFALVGLINIPQKLITPLQAGPPFFTQPNDSPHVSLRVQ